jgi:hypothetical protein
MRREEKREEEHALAWMKDKERVIVELFRDGVVVLCWRLVALANLAPGRCSRRQERGSGLSGEAGWSSQAMQDLLDRP